jgi:hypothetical protein
MHVRVASIGSSIVLAATFALVAGCSTGATFAQRMAYLGKMANEGVQTHRLIVSGGGAADEKRCNDAYSGLQDNNPPGDDPTGGITQGWSDQIKAFFVQSCVTGLPLPVPSQVTGGSSGSSGPSATPTP